MQKKSYQQPKAGIFYMIPDLKSGRYDVYSQTEEEGEEDPTHLFLWDNVSKKLQMRSKKDDSEFLPYYTGLPRGRVMAPYDKTGLWVIGIGGDFPLNEYKSEILSDFSLHDAESLGKVKFEVQTHEKMNPAHKKAVESLLGIESSASGFKKILKKKKSFSETIIDDVLEEENE